MGKGGAAGAGAGAGNSLLSNGFATLTTSQPFGEVPFFVEVPSPEVVYSRSVVRVLMLTKGAYTALSESFPQQCRKVLENLRRAACEVRGRPAGRGLRGRPLVAVWRRHSGQHPPGSLCMFVGLTAAWQLSCGRAQNSCCYQEDGIFENWTHTVAALWHRDPVCERAVGIYNLVTSAHCRHDMHACDVFCHGLLRCDYACAGAGCGDACCGGAISDRHGHARRRAGPAAEQGRHARQPAATAGHGHQR